MKKKIIKNNAYYTIAWSEERKYEKYDALKFLPELAGILSIYQKQEAGIRFILLYACWRDGLRVGLRKLMDPLYTQNMGLLRNLLNYPPFFYRFTVVDSSPGDMQDVFFRLINKYNPELNSSCYSDSGRYEGISVEEKVSSQIICV